MENQIDIERLDQALTLGIDHLLERQQTDGSWPGANLAGPQNTAVILVTEQYLGVLSSNDAEQGGRWLRHVQLEDGSFPPSPGWQSGSTDATGLGLAGLAAAGIPADDPARVRAAAWLEAHGGYDNGAQPTRVMAACMNLIDPKSLGRASFLIRWLPHADRMISKRFLFAIDFMVNALPPVIRGLQNGGPLNHRGPIRYFSYASTIRYLSRHQNTEGSWGGLLMATIFGLLALHFLGIRPWDPRMKAGLSFLKHCKMYGSDGMQGTPYSSEVWNTADAVSTLMRAPERPTSHSAVGRGVQFLLSQQNTVGVPRDWENPSDAAPTSGGWAYGIGNELTSDSDTTAAVLEALSAAADRAISPELANSIVRGQAWLKAMQNTDGSWPAFTHGLKPKPPGPMYKTAPQIPKTTFGMLRMFLNPPLEFGDAGWADLTGRVLRSLAAQGVASTSDEVQRGIGFLRAQIQGQQAWWGRWEVNFVTSSAYILVGLEAVDVSPDEPWVSGVLDWIESIQNDDGGWGDSAASYQDPSLKGTGPSRASITALVVSALVVLGRTGPAVDRAMAFLLNLQRSDGSWDVIQPIGVLQPPDQFYLNLVDAQCMIIDALARYSAWSYRDRESLDEPIATDERTAS